MSRYLMKIQMEDDKMNTEKKPMIKDGKEVCPCCDHHCPVENLHCANGKEYFGLPVEEKDRQRGGHRHPEKHRGGHHSMDERNMTEEEISMTLLRQCGHFLYHNMRHGEADSSRMFEALSEEEQKQLNVLLKKCLKGWQNL